MTDLSKTSGTSPTSASDIREAAIKAVLDNCVHNFSAAKIKVRARDQSFYGSSESLASFSDAINTLRQAQRDYEDAKTLTVGTGAAMLYVQQRVLGNPHISPDEHARWLKDAIAGAEPGSHLAMIGETLEPIGVEQAIEEVLLQEAQSFQFMNEDCLPDEPITARTMREVTGRALPLSLVAKTEGAS
jgi:hypothetical protein